MAQETTVREQVAENPKIIGALWALTLLLAQAGNAVAGAGGGVAGP